MLAQYLLLFNIWKGHASSYCVFHVWRPLILSPCRVLSSVLFLLSSSRPSSDLPYACSARNRPSIVFILSVNGPHLAGHRGAICPPCDGCILSFLQLHFWQTDIWAHLKPGGITFSQVCNVGIWPCRKPCKPRHACLKLTEEQSFFPLCILHWCKQNGQQKHNSRSRTWNHNHYPQLYLYRFLVRG